jgi:hypothetical protein
VRQRFQDESTSQPAKRVHADIRKLNLPAQPEFKEEFFACRSARSEKKRTNARGRHKPHPPHPWHKKKSENREKHGVSSKRSGAKEKNRSRTNVVLPEPGIPMKITASMLNSYSLAACRHESLCMATPSECAQLRN